LRAGGDCRNVEGDPTAAGRCIGAIVEDGAIESLPGKLLVRLFASDQDRDARRLDAVQRRNRRGQQRSRIPVAVRRPADSGIVVDEAVAGIVDAYWISCGRYDAISWRRTPLGRWRRAATAAQVAAVDVVDRFLNVSPDRG
jgi:hypothetical protein